MKPDLNELEALQNQKYIESKIDMVPASLREIRSAIGTKEAVLIARELIVNERIVIGIEYAPDGRVASAYTSDENGKRVMLENTRGSVEKKTSADMISQRLEIVKSMTREERAHTAENAAATPPAAKTVRRQMGEKELKQFQEYQANRRGC